MFSDEKLFSVEEKLNRQNSRIYALTIKDISEDMRTVQRFQKEKKIMVWYTILKKKSQFPMIFVESGTRINASF